VGPAPRAGLAVALHTVTRRAGTRPPAVAGTFYPADAMRLAAEVDRLLAAAAAPAAPKPSALIVPHAGYRYSGPVAATAYRQLAPTQRAVRRVVVLGPDHFTGLRGIAVPSWGAFATPLGEVPVDQDACLLAASLPAVLMSDIPHLREHALEVQLPFLQRTLGPETTMVPVLIGHVGARLIADLIEALWDDESTAVVVTTDLSHYHDQATARRLDQRTAGAIVRKQAAAVGERDACGCLPVRGLLELACRRKLRVRQLDLRTSADTAGDPSRVVGYGAFALHAD